MQKLKDACSVISSTLDSVEYHATLESCSDKFEVNIPSVVRVSACNTYRDFKASFLRQYLALIVAIILFPLQRSHYNKNELSFSSSSLHRNISETALCFLKTKPRRSVLTLS
jgi:hypothetical protein